MVPIPIRRSTLVIALLALISTPGSTVAQSPASGHAPDDPALAAVELMNMVPTGVMETCVPYAPSLAGQRAVAQCTLGSATVIYGSFEDFDSLATAYADLTSVVSIEGDATSCAEGPYSGAYRTADGAEAGSVTCTDGDPGLLLAWADATNLVIGLLSSPDEEGYDVLHDRWLRVRLDAPAITAASPSATRAPGRLGAAPAATAQAGTQWAVGALASSQYGSDAWSASQATGEPDTSAYGDRPTAWAPSASEAGEEWIELTYGHAVVPAAVDIHESSGAGSVIRVEAWDEDADAWVVLWEGTDPSPDALSVFSPPLDPVTIATDRIRVTLDSSVPGWNEIDAVSLTGTQP